MNVTTESPQQEAPPPPSEESLPTHESKVIPKSNPEPSATQRPPPSFIRSIQRSIRVFLEPRVETFFRTIFFWETDDKQIGRLVRAFHSNILTVILIVYWISHTVLHSYWLLWLLWTVLGLIWIQHVLAGCCILTRIEQRLIGDTECVLDPMMRLFQIPTTNENGKGLTIFLSTTFFLLQSLELYSRTVLNIQSFLFFLPHMLFH